MCTAAILFTTMLACLNHAVMPGNTPLHLPQASALSSPAGLGDSCSSSIFCAARDLQCARHDLSTPARFIAIVSVLTQLVFLPDATEGMKATQPDTMSAVPADHLSTNQDSSQPSVPDQGAKVYEALLPATADTQATPGLDTVLQHSTVPPVSLFMSGHGVRIQLSAESQAHGQSILQLQGEEEDTGPAATAVSAAPPASANSSEAVLAVAGKSAVAASGCTYGQGKPFNLSARGLARAQQIFQSCDEATDPSIQPQQRPRDDDNRHQNAQLQQPPPCTGFTVGMGKPIVLTAKGKAHAARFFAQTDTGVHATEAEQQATGSKGNSPVGSHAQASAAVPVAFGFTCGNGKVMQVSAQAQSNARNLFQDENIPEASHAQASAAAPVASGFTCGNGKDVQVSAQAQSNARHLFQDENIPEASHAQASAAAPVASGFTRGNGKDMQVSAQAQSNARHLFQDENNIPASVGTATAQTPAAVNKPSVRLASGKGVLTTPKTAPTGVKPVLKRGTTTVGGSGGGLLFKKPRMSRLHTPRTLGITPNRVQPLFCPCADMNRQRCVCRHLCVCVVCA